MVKQNIVFVENTPGSLQKVTKILAENQIDIYGFGCFDAPEFANFRMVMFPMYPATATRSLHNCS